jgi:hypothetical protein
VIVLVNELFEWSVEEDISIGGVSRDKIERRIPSSNDRNGSRDNLMPIEVSQIPMIPERSKFLSNSRPSRRAVRFEIDQKNDRLIGVCIEDTTDRGVEDTTERRGRILLIENLNQRVNV